MSKQEVIDFVGQPTRRVYEGDFEKGSGEMWYFDFYEPHTREFQPHWIRIKDGRVLSCELDRARVVEHQRELKEQAAARLAAQIIPPDVGFKCDDDSQCQSKKCLDHKCAGPRGCTRAPGADCLTDLDCCTLKCSQASRTCL